MRLERVGVRLEAGVHARSSQPPDKVEILRDKSLSGPRNLRQPQNLSGVLTPPMPKPIRLSAPSDSIPQDRSVFFMLRFLRGGGEGERTSMRGMSPKPPTP